MDDATIADMNYMYGEYPSADWNKVFGQNPNRDYIGEARRKEALGYALKLNLSDKAEDLVSAAKIIEDYILNG